MSAHIEFEVRTIDEHGDALNVDHHATKAEALAEAAKLTAALPIAEYRAVAAAEAEALAKKQRACATCGGERNEAGFCIPCLEKNGL